MLKKIEEILQELFDLDSYISLDTQFIRDLCLDSIDVVNVIVRVEDEFNIKVEDKDIHKLISVGDVINYISTKK